MRSEKLEVRSEKGDWLVGRVGSHAKARRCEAGNGEGRGRIGRMRRMGRIGRGASTEPRGSGFERRGLVGGRGASTFTRDWGHRQDACATLRAVILPAVRSLRLACSEGARGPGLERRGPTPYGVVATLAVNPGYRFAPPRAIHRSSLRDGLLVGSAAPAGAMIILCVRPVADATG